MKNSFIITIFVFLAAGILYGASFLFREGEDSRVVCTTEALACPDGSYVGRSGPACAFAACPIGGALEGVLEKQGESYRLLMAVPEGTSLQQEVSYSLPLIISDPVFADELLGTKVSVAGLFTDGNTFRVSAIEKLAGEIDDSTSITLGIGASGFIHGVQITVNSVIQDSRCASDVQCIQAGSFTAEVILQSDTDKEVRTFTAGADAVRFDSYQIRLTKVAPVPVSTTPITLDEYRLTFEVVVNQ